MTLSQARDRVIEAANEVTNQAKLMRAGLEAGNIAVAFDTRYRDSVTELIKECDDLARLESATPVSHPAPNDTLPAPADVCECGHGMDSHAINQNGNNRCWHICTCTKYRPKQKGGE